MRRFRYQIQREPKANWIIGPIVGCVDFLAVEMAMAGVMIRGLELMPLIPPLLKVAANAAVKKHGLQALTPFREFLSQDMAYEGMSERLAEDDFALANAHTLISLWAGVETCIEDTIVLALMNDQLTVDAVKHEIKQGVHLSGFLDEEGARRIHRALERKARQDRNVADAYDWCLGLLGIRRVPSSDLSVPLTEINALRNAIVHCAGIADQRTVDAAPSLGLKVGDEIRLSRNRILLYYSSMATFVRELLSGAIESRHVRTREELNAGGS